MPNAKEPSPFNSSPKQQINTNSTYLFLSQIHNLWMICKRDAPARVSKIDLWPCKNQSLSEKQSSNKTSKSIAKAKPYKFLILKNNRSVGGFSKMDQLLSVSTKNQAVSKVLNDALSKYISQRIHQENTNENYNSSSIRSKQISLDVI